VDVVSFLIDSRASLDIQNTRGETTLHFAAYHGQSAIVDLLLKNGADATLKTVDGRTAADLAGEKGNQEISARLAQILPNS